MTININSSNNINTNNENDFYNNIKRLESNNVKGSIKTQKNLVRQLSNNIKNLKIKYNNSSHKLTANIENQTESSRLLVINRRSIPLVQYLNHNLYAVRTPWRYISREDTLRNNIDELLNFFKLFQKLYNYGYYTNNIVCSKRKQYNKPISFLTCGPDTNLEDLETLEYEYLVKFHNNVYSKISVLFPPLSPRFGDENTSVTSDPNRNISAIFNKFGRASSNISSGSSAGGTSDTSNTNNQNVLCCDNKFYGIKTFGERVLNHQKYVVLDLCSDCTANSYNDGKLKYEFLNEFNKQIVEIKLNKYFLPSLSNIFKVVSIVLFWVKFDFNFVVINYNRINFNVLLLFACVILLFNSDFSDCLAENLELTNDTLTETLTMLENKLLNTLKWREYCDNSFEQYPFDQNQPKVGLLSKKDQHSQKLDTYHKGGSKDKLNNITEMYWIYKWPPSYKRYLLYYIYINNKLLKDNNKEKEDNENKEKEDEKDKEKETSRDLENMNYVYDEKDVVNVLERKYYELNSITLYNCLMPNFSIDIEVYQMNKDNDLYNYDDPNYVNSILNSNFEEQEEEEDKEEVDENYFNNFLRNNNTNNKDTSSQEEVNKDNINLDCLNYQGVTFNNCKCRYNFNNKLLKEKENTNNKDEDNNEINYEQKDSVGDDAVLVLCPHNYVKHTSLGSGHKRQSHPSSPFNFNRFGRQVSNHYIDKVVYDYNKTDNKDTSSSLEEVNKDKNNKEFYKKNVVYDDVCVVFVLRVNKVDRKVICSYSFNTSMLDNLVVNNYNHNGFKISGCGLKKTNNKDATSNKDNGVELVLGIDDLDMWYKNQFLEDSYFVFNLTPVDYKNNNTNNKDTTSSLEEVNKDEKNEKENKETMNVDKEYYKYFKNGSVYNFINNHVKWVNMIDVYNLYKLTNHNIETIVLSLKICNTFSDSLNLLINLKKPYHSNYYNINDANYYYNKVNQEGVPLGDADTKDTSSSQEVLEEERDTTSSLEEVNKDTSSSQEDKLFSKKESDESATTVSEVPLFSPEYIAGLSNKLLEQHQVVDKEDKEKAKNKQQELDNNKLYINKDLLLKLKESNVVISESLDENLGELDNENLVKLLSYSNLSLNLNLGKVKEENKEKEKETQQEFKKEVREDLERIKKEKVEENLEQLEFKKKLLEQLDKTKLTQSQQENLLLAAESVEKFVYDDVKNLSSVEKELLLLLKNYDEEERKKVVENIKKNQLLYLSNLNLGKVKGELDKDEEVNKEQQLDKEKKKLLFLEEKHLLGERQQQELLYDKKKLLEQHKLFVEEQQKVLEKEKEVVDKVESEKEKETQTEQIEDSDSEKKEVLLTTELNIKTPVGSTSDLLLLEQQKKEEKEKIKNKQQELENNKLEEDVKNKKEQEDKLFKEQQQKILAAEAERQKLIEKEKQELLEKQRLEKEQKPVVKKAGEVRLKKGGKAPPPPKGPIKSVKRVLPLGIKLHWKPLMPNKLNNTIFQLSDGSTIKILNNIFTQQPKGNNNNQENTNNKDTTSNKEQEQNNNNDLINVVTIKKLFSRSSIGSSGNISASSSSVNLGENNRGSVGSEGSEDGNVGIKKIKSAASLIEQNKICLLDNKRAQNISIILRYSNFNEYMDILNKINGLEPVRINSKFKNKNKKDASSSQEEANKDTSKEERENSKELENMDKILDNFREEVEILDEVNLFEVVSKLNIIYPNSNEVELLLNNYNYQLSNYDEENKDTSSILEVIEEESKDTNNNINNTNNKDNNRLIGVDETYNVKVLEKYRYIERILLELILRKNIYGKIKLIKLMVDINNNINVINEQLEIYSKAVTEIKGNVILPILLNIILKYGNYINYGNIDQGDIGFTLSSTVKLMDFKSLDNNISSLHYLILNLYIKLFLVSNPHLDAENDNTNNKDTSSNKDNTNQDNEDKVETMSGNKEDNMEIDKNNQEKNNNNKEDKEKDVDNKQELEENLDIKLLNIDVELKNVLLAEKISSRGITENLNELSAELFDIINYFNITPGGSGVNSARMLDCDSMSSGSGGYYNAGVSTSSSSSSNTSRSSDDLDINRKINNVINIYKLKLNGVNEYRKNVFENVAGIWMYLGEDVNTGNMSNKDNTNQDNEVGSNLDLERIFVILSELIKCIKKIFNDIKSKPVKYLILLNNDSYKHIFLKLFMDNKALNYYYKTNKS